jgi:predicted PurR-regulated permease PerM
LGGVGSEHVRRDRPTRAVEAVEKGGPRVVPPPKESDAAPVREAQRAVERGTLAWWQVALVAGVAIALALGLLAVIGQLFRPLVLLVLAIVFASAVEPLVRWLDRWMRRTIAVVIVFLSVVAAFGALAWYVIPRIAEQAMEVAREVPALLEQARGVITGWDETAADQGIDLLVERIGDITGWLARLPVAVVGGVFDVILVFILAVYWSVFMPQMRWFFLSLFPAGKREEVGGVVGEIGHMMGGFIRAVVIDAIVVGIIVYVGLLIIGVRFPLLLALIAAMGEIIPIVGPFIGGGAAVGVALLDSPTQALIVLVFYLVLQQIESNVLVPIIMHRTASIPPPLGIFALMAGAAVGGPIVAITAIPLSGAIYVFALRVIAPLIRQWTGADDDPLPPEDEDEGDDGEEGDKKDREDEGDESHNTGKEKARQRSRHRLVWWNKP